MAATIVVTCPKCKNHLKGPAEVQGRKVRCKSCGTIFTAQANAPATTKAAPANRTRPVAPPAKKSAAKATKPESKPPPPASAPADDGKNPYGIMDDDFAMQLMAQAQALAPLPGARRRGQQGHGRGQESVWGHHT